MLMTTINSLVPKTSAGRYPMQLGGTALLMCVACFLAGCGVLESEPPVVAFDREFEVLGRDASVELTVVDESGGVAEVHVVLIQEGQEVVLVDESFEEPTDGDIRTYDIGRLILDKYSVQDGPASIGVTVVDGSYSGNQAEVTRNFQFDLYPPRLEVLSGLLYINQGGSEAVVYRVSDDAVSSGVQVGPHFFPGFPTDFDGNRDTHFALFAFQYDLPTDTSVTVIARDGAGNESVLSVRNQVSPLAMRNREIGVDDAFLQKVVPEIMSQSPQIRDQGSLLDTYVEINSRLRSINHESIAEMSKASEGEFLWDGGFLQLSNSQVESLFADRRTYMYDGEPIDQQDHVGFDLSVVAGSPNEATNAGRVILAEYFGIYGNTVLIDHGAGLISLYGHMSSIDVATGQMVGKGDILGRSGATGLAGGDHLHFGLFLHGVPVNPIEWWDARWVEEHVLAKLSPPVE